ncbi:hypothetical protein HK104_010142 [Borealophlyctis nickersoniae]|nr:hypothetical protein HK104_010142 [Borealophlyctis nickersoniae]
MKNSKQRNSCSDFVVFLPLIVIVFLILFVLFIGRRQRRRRAQPVVDPAGNDVPAQQHNAEGESEEEGEGEEGPVVRRIGKKKAEKLRRKEQRRQYLEFIEQQRADQRLRQELIEEETEKRHALQSKQRRKEEERRWKRREEEAKQKELENERRRVEEEHERIRSEEVQNGVDVYLKAHKFVDIEKAADSLDLTAEELEVRIQASNASAGTTGFFSGHGLFIQMSTAEMQALATHITQQGRISKADIASWCNDNVARHFGDPSGDGETSQAEY